MTLLKFIQTLEFIARWDQRLAYTQAKRFVCFTPNQITTASLFIAVISIGLLGMGHFVAGAFLHLFQRVVDCWDGGVARIRNMSTAVGSFYDHFVDWFVVSGTFLALAISLPTHQVLGCAGICLVTVMHVIAFICRIKEGELVWYFPTKQLEQGQTEPQRLLKAIFDLFRADWTLIVFAVTGTLWLWMLLRLIGTLGMCCWLPWRKLCLR